MSTVTICVMGETAAYDLPSDMLPDVAAEIARTSLNAVYAQVIAKLGSVRKPGAYLAGTAARIAKDWSTRSWEARSQQLTASWRRRSAMRSFVDLQAVLQTMYRDGLGHGRQQRAAITGHQFEHACVDCAVCDAAADGDWGTFAHLTQLNGEGITLENAYKSLRDAGLVEKARRVTRRSHASDDPDAI